MAGEGHTKSDDIRFWSKLFQKFRPDFSVKILAVGSCNTLEEIANDIVSNETRNVCVAMDKDYRDIWRQMHSNRFVIYTRTYSWENELFQDDVIYRAFNKIADDSHDEGQVLAWISEATSSLALEFRHFFRADVVLVAANSSFFCRKSSGASFKQVRKPDKLPKVDVVRLRKELREKRARAKGVRLLNRPRCDDICRDIYGKPLLFAARRILQYLALCADLPSIPNFYLDKFLVEGFSEWLDANPTSAISEDYRNKIQSVFEAA